MKPFSMRPVLRDRGWKVAGLLLPIMGSGCCTTSLWGCTAGDEMLVPPERRAVGKGHQVFDSHAEWTAWSVARRVALTPVALGLDVITLPNQLGELVLGPSPSKERRAEAAKKEG